MTQKMRKAVSWQTGQEGTFLEESCLVAGASRGEGVVLAARSERSAGRATLMVRVPSAHACQGRGRRMHRLRDGSQGHTASHQAAEAHVPRVLLGQAVTADRLTHLLSYNL